MRSGRTPQDLNFSLLPGGYTLDLREFLDHVVWYWIVARQWQALKFQQDRNEGELRPITATRSEEFLLRLFDLREKIKRRETRALTYASHLCALRVTRSEFGLTLGNLEMMTSAISSPARAGRSTISCAHLSANRSTERGANVQSSSRRRTVPLATSA